MPDSDKLRKTADRGNHRLPSELADKPDQVNIPVLTELVSVNEFDEKIPVLDDTLDAD